MEKRESGEELMCREYFVEMLGEGSQDFLELEKMVEDTDGKISWERLLKYTKIDDGMVEGIYWDGILNLKGTRIRSLGRLKRVNLGLDCDGVESLEDLGELEDVGALFLRGTRVRSLGKLKRVIGYLDFKGFESLEHIGELEEVGGELFLIWTRIEVQLEVSRRINEGKLKVKKGVSYGGNIEGIEKLLESEKILGSLDLRGTRVKSLGKLKRVNGYLDCSGIDILANIGELEEVGGRLNLKGTRIEVQLEVFRKINDGKLRVKGVLYGGNIEGIEKLLEEKVIYGDLDLEGTNVRSLGKLKEAGGNLNCSGLESLEHIGELEEVGGRLNLRGTGISVQLEVIKSIIEGKLKVGGEVVYDEIIKSLKIEKMAKGEVNLFGKIVDMWWIRLFRVKLGEYSENEDEILREIRILIGKVMIGKYDKSIKEYLEKNKDKLNQEIVNSIEKDFGEKKGLFKRLFGEKLVEEMF